MKTRNRLLTDIENLMNKCATNPDKKYVLKFDELTRPDLARALADYVEQSNSKAVIKAVEKLLWKRCSLEYDFDLDYSVCEATCEEEYWCQKLAELKGENK
ncbi:MAG: hypothetical protein LBK68_03085 [Candidatus Margulisbacteria bacterium]|jgi:hypothetical protein|nr:hypothetical protein [Candidatus Margulisiibacteriota bacterium]